MVLLDSCVLIWIANGEHAKLSVTAREHLTTHPWAVSALSAWEIAIKHAAGKLSLRSDPQSWWSSVVAFHHLVLLDFSPAAAVRAGALPLLHADPFDRGLVATALTRSIPLVTPDERIHAYRDVGLAVVW
ncbi:MAG: type II toxin-antitoxin system VapC family toxin [Myxococcales bacterium]|nr:type II toxin-antitoxin system VapC family toxin [Myxococcales bacterium]